MERVYSTGSESGWTKAPVDAVLRGEDGFAVSGGRISAEAASSAFEIDTSGCHVFPAPINSHDHLLGSWTPKVGSRRYRNVYEWLDELHHPDDRIRAERDTNPPEDIYSLGVYKNILSGTSTVNDHYVRMPDRFWEQFPVRIIHRFGRTWTLRDETGWGGTIEEELEEAGTAYPYIIHISEGVDEESRKELKSLASRGGVRSNTVLIHGIAFDGDDMDLIAERRASIVWCPSSNMFLYGATLNVPEALKRGINVCLGTDSTLSGCSNIFDEARYASVVFRELFGRELAPRTLYEMMTSNAAEAFLLKGETGCLSEGALADVLILKSENDDPYSCYLRTEPDGIDLLLISGKPAVGDVRHKDFFEMHCETYSEITVGGRTKLVVGDPVSLMVRIEERIGRRKELPFLPVRR